MIKAMATTAKLLGFVVLFAVVFQTFASYAEHVGVMECASSSAKADAADQEHPAEADECCLHLVAVFFQSDNPCFFNSSAMSFFIKDDIIPESPAATIDQPPRLA